MVNLNSVEGIESLIEKRTKPLKKQIKELTNLVNELKAAINYTRCCTELPMIEELIISEIRRKQQKQVDDEVERFLNGNGTDCRLRGFFSEQDLKE
jgi:hypothetical protein